MTDRILFPEWRAQNSTTRYPFTDRAGLATTDGRVILDGQIVDAALYPVGAAGGLYLSLVTVDHQQVTFTLSDDTGVVATGTSPLANPPELVTFTDLVGRPAGVMVVDPIQFGAFQGWGVGDHAFVQAEAEFCPTVHFPAPEVGVRGIKLESGEIFTGDVWLVGDDGVVLRVEADEPATLIRVDVVGDPLFRRQLCRPSDLFTTPRFVEAVRVVRPNGQSFLCKPDAEGDLPITVHNAFVKDTILRIVTTPTSVKISAVGSAVTTG